jgi:indole-3-glycerol phosphate synthase
MRVDLRTTLRLAGLLDETDELVSESGIRTPDDVRRLKAAGIRAVLIGQILCEQPDVGAKFHELFG